MFALNIFHPGPLLRTRDVDGAQAMAEKEAAVN